MDFVYQHGRPSTYSSSVSASSTALDSTLNAQHGEHVADLHNNTFTGSKAGRLRYIQPSCKLLLCHPPLSLPAGLQSELLLTADVCPNDFAVVNNSWLCLTLSLSLSLTKTFPLSYNVTTLRDQWLNQDSHCCWYRPFAQTHRPRDVVRPGIASIVLRRQWNPGSRRLPTLRSRCQDSSL